MRWIGTLALAVLAGAVACDRADRGADSAPAGFEDGMPAGMDPGIMGAMMEMQEIQQRLQPIQQQALEDQALAGQLATVSGQIEAAMREENPELVDRIDRFQADMEAAEAAGDEARLQAMMMEAQTLQMEAQALQVSVMERPHIREGVEAFDAAHRARMIEIDPEAASLLARADELMARFRP